MEWDFHLRKVISFESFTEEFPLVTNTKSLFKRFAFRSLGIVETDINFLLKSQQISLSEECPMSIMVH